MRPWLEEFPKLQSQTHRWSNLDHWTVGPKNSPIPKISRYSRFPLIPHAGTGKFTYIDHKYLHGNVGKYTRPIRCIWVWWTFCQALGKFRSSRFSQTFPQVQHPILLKKIGKHPTITTIKLPHSEPTFQLHPPTNDPSIFRPVSLQWKKQVSNLGFRQFPSTSSNHSKKA